MVVPFYRRTSEKQQLSTNHTSMSETKIELGWKGKAPAEPRFTSLPPPPSAPCCSQEGPSPQSKQTVGTRPSLGRYLMMEGVFDTPIPSVDG